jgi:adenylate cyclase
MSLHERGFSGSGILAAKESQRRLLAILAADVVGYTRLMQAEEDVTHSRMRQLRSEVIDPNIARYRGRIVKNTGDGFLATFENAHDATHCAIEIQQEMIDRNSGEPVARQINFRTGINVADIIVEPEDVYGDGVNIALGCRPMPSRAAS